MTRLARRVAAKKPLDSAEVTDRAMVRSASAAFESSTRAQLEAAIASRTWSQGCEVCGSVLTFHGSLDDWLSKSIAWDESHPCEVSAMSSPSNVKGIS